MHRPVWSNRCHPATVDGMSTPIALLVDDSCPLVHVYRWHVEHVHAEPPRTRDGRHLVDRIPNDFLDRFCDVTSRYGMKGKISIVPAPASRGDVVNGIEGDPAATRAWLDTARRRLGGAFDFTPEMITHDLAVDLPTGRLLDKGESVWSQTQDRATLTPYVTRALRYLKDADVDATGVTSPWIFGKDVEGEYTTALMAAQREVYGRKRSWYFLHMLEKHPELRPWVERDGPEGTLVSIPTTTDDVWWKSIDDPRSDSAFAQAMADEMLVAVWRILGAGGWPVLLTHWQSLFSNGTRAGLDSLEIVGRTVRETLGDRVHWASCSELMEMTIASGARRPAFLART